MAEYWLMRIRVFDLESMLRVLARPSAEVTSGTASSMKASTRIMACPYSL